MVENLKLPTLKQTEEKVQKWRKFVIDFNVKKVVSSMKDYSGEVLMEWETQTFFDPQNIIDCVIGELRDLKDLEGKNQWHFRHISKYGCNYIEFSSFGFYDKPWWRFW